MSKIAPAWPPAGAIAILAPMAALIFASLDPHEGRTTVAAALGGLIASSGGAATLLRVRAESGADPAAEDDAATFARVPGCSAPSGAVSAQDAVAQARADGTVIVEALPGLDAGLAGRLPARAVIVSARFDGERLAALAGAANTLGDAFLGVILTRVPERSLDAARGALEGRGLACIAALPEDRLLAGPAVRELAETLHASRLHEGADEDEGLEFVMLGPISADPGQPYFLQHGAKAVVQRFDKMDLHLAALATEPDCLVLTGGQQPSPYFLDRVRGGGGAVTVLLSPEDTVRTVELLDDLYGRTRFSGRRKLDRAIELMRAHADVSFLQA